MLDNTSIQPGKFRTKNWVEIHDDSRGMYNTNSQIKFKTSMLRSSLCDYSDAYILVNGSIIITGARNDGAARLDEGNKGVTSGSLWQYYRDYPNDNITQSESFKYKIKITGKTPADGKTKDVERAVSWKYLINFWGTFEMPFINCEILGLNWFEDCLNLFLLQL